MYLLKLIPSTNVPAALVCSNSAPPPLFFKMSFFFCPEYKLGFGNRVSKIHLWSQFIYLVKSSHKSCVQKL